MKKNILFILSITISFFTTNHLSLASTPQTTLTEEEGAHPRAKSLFQSWDFHVRRGQCMMHAPLRVVEFECAATTFKNVARWGVTHNVAALDKDKDPQPGKK